MSGNITSSHASGSNGGAGSGNGTDGLHTHMPPDAAETPAQPVAEPAEEPPAEARRRAG